MSFFKVENSRQLFLIYFLIKFFRVLMILSNDFCIRNFANLETQILSLVKMNLIMSWMQLFFFARFDYIIHLKTRMITIINAKLNNNISEV